MRADDPIFVAGHNGLVGSAIVRALTSEGYRNVLVTDRSQLDLTRQSAVDEFFSNRRPAYVFLAAAKAGGIRANSQCPAQFLYDNLAIQSNVIDAAYRYGARKLLFIGSNCIYPKNAPQPIPESAVLSGPLEPTVEWYAIAKIAGLKLAQAYRREYNFNAISLMPPNLYGPCDKFDLATAHVLPALLRKFHEAKTYGADIVEVWGSGTQRREFLHVDDLANACVYLMLNYDDESLINVGWGIDVSIAELAESIARIVGFTGTPQFNESKPAGPGQKLLDISRIRALGWEPRIDLVSGIRSTYDWFVRNPNAIRV